ncbi:MAG: 3-hydroxyacyl-ACP dehydratase FabZ [Proteobacteria bacterium]|jgi:3-hydroxyacyl-[acyl-carrier-protein] dehydratase|nr:3-hydroxyacyl-ACP dehydratase FabZ [Pseudomonadota bacterium]MDA0995413.1 3-hydroxyacyl-ACP dehydratase FabZ [Pseudomonadota bacterium]
MKTELNLEQIKNLLPHRQPMLLIEKISNILNKVSATGHINVVSSKFYFDGHYPGQPVFPGVLIVEAFGQTAAALSAHSLDPKEIEDKLVFLMTIDKARFRNPIVPPCELLLNVKVEKIKGRIWKYSGVALVGNKVMADAQWMATIADRNDK